MKKGRQLTRRYGDKQEKKVDTRKGNDRGVKTVMRLTSNKHTDKAVLKH